MKEASQDARDFVTSFELTEVGKEVAIPTKDSQAVATLVRELTAAVKEHDEALTVVVKPGAGDATHTVLTVKLGRLSVSALFSRIVAEMSETETETETDADETETDSEAVA